VLSVSVCPLVATSDVVVDADSLLLVVELAFLVVVKLPLPAQHTPSPSEFNAQSSPVLQHLSPQQLWPA
jgi:hypothetical protein